MRTRANRAAGGGTTGDQGRRTPPGHRAANVSSCVRAIFTDWDRARLGLYQSVLESAGIRCFIRGYHDDYGGTPTLCVTDDPDFPRAWELLRQMRSPEPTVAADWTCPTCGEAVPGNFEGCWQCGEDRPA